MVECSGLENLRTERFREFESHLLRQLEETKNGYVWSVDYNWGKYIGRCIIGTYGMGPYQKWIRKYL